MPAKPSRIQVPAAILPSVVASLAARLKVSQTTLTQTAELKPEDSTQLDAADEQNRTCHFTKCMGSKSFVRILLTACSVFTPKFVFFMFTMWRR